MYGYIYLTTNKINNKKYIGQHKANKFEGNKYLGSGMMLLRAIETYGANNFEVTLLKECESKEDLDLYEKEYIKKYNATKSSQFYNLSKGGQGGDFHTEDMIEKLRIARLSQKSQTKGKRKINNGMREKLVLPEELDTYLNQGWKLGRLYNTTKGMVYVNKDDKVTAIPKDELESYLSKGWKKGNAGHSCHSGTCHINNGEIAKMVDISEVDSYLSQGWVRGRIYKGRATTIESIDKKKDLVK